MIIIAIVSGITIGWVLGNYLLDKWVNDGMDDIENKDNNENK